MKKTNIEIKYKQVKSILKKLSPHKLLKRRDSKHSRIRSDLSIITKPKFKI